MTPSSPGAASGSMMAWDAAERDQIVVSDQVQRYLFKEARLLDERRYEEWLGLWLAEPQTCYWVPCNADEIDPRHHVSLIYDDRVRLEERITRLMSPAVHSQDPPSRTARVVSNVELEAGEDRSEVKVHSTQVVGEFRNGDQTSYFCRVSHSLAVVEGDFFIREKKVLLINNDGYLRNLTFLL